MYVRKWSHIAVCSNKGRGFIFRKTPAKPRTMNRLAMGIKALRLRDGEYLVTAKKVDFDKDKYFLIFTKMGFVKSSKISDFPILKKLYRRGCKYCTLREGDEVVELLVI